MSNNNWDNLYKRHTYLITGGVYIPCAFGFARDCVLFLSENFEAGLQTRLGFKFFFGANFLILIFYMMPFFSPPTLSFEP